MRPEVENGASSFFMATSQAFRETIRVHRSRPDLVGALCAQAFDSFEKNILIQAEGAPATACKGDCDACCTLRVTASAPEIFLLARFVDVNAPVFAERGVDLPTRVAETSGVVRGASESERFALRRGCPMLEKGFCLAYRLRPLACRGHAAFDKEACGAVARGEDVQVDVSTPHLVLRSLVQNALLSALRDGGLSWRLYELNQAVAIALADPSAMTDWIAGRDPLAPAAIAEFDATEAGATFDALAGG